MHLARKHAGALLIGAGIYQLVVLSLYYPGEVGFRAPQAMDVLAPLVLLSTLEVWAVCFALGLVYDLKAMPLQPQHAKGRLYQHPWERVGTTTLSSSTFGRGERSRLQ